MKVQILGTITKTVPWKDNQNAALIAKAVKQVSFQVVDETKLDADNNPLILVPPQVLPLEAGVTQADLRTAVTIRAQQLIDAIPAVQAIEEIAL